MEHVRAGWRRSEKHARGVEGNRQGLFDTAWAPCTRTVKASSRLRATGCDQVLSNFRCYARRQDTKP
jgi:hypothetical protein